MKQKLVIMISILMVLGVFSSCSKDENTSTAESITTTTGTTVTTTSEPEVTSSASYWVLRAKI